MKLHQPAAAFIAAASLILSYAPGVFGDEVSSQTSSGTASEAFSELIDSFYWNSVSFSPVNLHFIQSSTENIPISLENPTGTFSETYEEEIALYQDTLDSLLAIPVSELDSHDRQVRNTLKSYLETELTLMQLPDYASVLGPMSGLLTSLNTAVTEYYLLSETDIANYMDLLSDIPHFLEDLNQELDYQESIGCSCTSYVIEKALEKEAQMTSLDSNPYLESFAENIKDCGLDAETESSYLSQVTALMSDTVIPAFSSFYDSLREREASAGDCVGLCSYEEGKEYYAALAAYFTGTDLSPEEMMDYLESHMISDLQSMSILYYFSSSDNINAADSFTLDSEDPATILNRLKEHTLEEFPEITNTDFTVSWLPESLEVDNSLAYYMLPPYDLLSRNTIRANKSQISDDDLTLYVTLAHEGFPGHLYQTQYYSQNYLEYPAERILTTTGTSEGWAFYAERLALDWSGLDDDAADFYWYNETLSMALSAVCDIGVNYMGWSLSDLSAYLSEYYDISDETIIQDLFDTLASDPGVYLPYAVGYYEISDLFSAISSNYSSNADMYAAFFKYSNMPFTLIYQYLNADGSI